MLVDCFMFYNELDVLELRLSILDSKVDRFVLVESEVTHAGQPKELIFEQNKARYAKWAHKIVHIVARNMPTDENPWSREKYQRACALDGLYRTVTIDGTDVYEVPDDAHVMISDVDEIPDLARFDPMPEKTTACHMHMFEYSFKYTFTGEPWFGTVITHAKEFRKLGPNFFRDNRWRFGAALLAGWHLSSFGDAKHVHTKVHTYAHAKDPGKHAHQTLEVIDDILAKGLHHDGKTPLIPTPPETRMPPGWETFMARL